MPYAGKVADIYSYTERSSEESTIWHPKLTRLEFFMLHHNSGNFGTYFTCYDLFKFFNENVYFECQPLLVASRFEIEIEIDTKVKFFFKSQDKTYTL